MFDKMYFRLDNTQEAMNLTVCLAWFKELNMKPSM